MVPGDDALQHAGERIKALESDLRRAHEELAAADLLRAGKEQLEAGMREREAELVRINRDLLREVEERKRVEEMLHRVNRALTMLSKANEALIRAREEQALLQEICRIIVEVGGYQLAWVGYPENDAGKSIRPVAQAGFESGYVERVGATWADVPRGRGPAGTAVRTGQPVVIHDVRTDPAFAPWRDDALQRGYRAVMSLPLTENERTFGVILIYSAAPDSFEAEEVRLLEEMANDLSYGIVALRTRAERSRALAALRLDESRLEALLRLSRMSDASVPEIAQSTLAEAVQITHSALGCLAFVNEDETEMTVQAWWKQATDECLVARCPRVYSIEASGPWGEAVRRREPVIVNDSTTLAPGQQGCPGAPEVLQRHMSVPIFAGERIVAVMAVANKEEEYDEADVRQLSLLGSGMWRILDRKRALDALRQEKERAQRYLDIAGVILLAIDADERVSLINQKGCEVLGHRAEEICGRNWFDTFIPPRERERVRAVFRQIMAGEVAPVEYFENPVLTSAGEERLIAWHNALLRDETGRPAGTLSSGEDVTERRRIEAEAQVANERILHSEIERKRFYREVIRAVTRDKLHLVDPGEIPDEGVVVWETSLQGREAYRALRERIHEAAVAKGMPVQAARDLVLAVAEAAANAIKHAGGGCCTLYVSDERVLVRVSDRGSGIRPENLPATLFLPGYSTTVSLGMGYTLMLELVDDIWLSTGPEGTTVQLAKWLRPEEHRPAPIPAEWSRL